MDRNREARRSTSMAASNGLARRRHRTSHRDSPEEDGPMELQETTRLRDRGGSGKKDRDRTRDRDRDRDRDRLSRNKRRAERMLHGSIREDGGDDSSEGSLNDEEEEEEDRVAGDVSGSGHMRLVPPPSSYQASSLSSSMLIHNSRRNFPPVAAAAAKVFRPAAPWKAADEMIGVSVPRKARSASTKRSHEWLSSSGHMVAGSSGEQFLQQASASPVRTGLPATTASPVRPISPSSSIASGMKRMKPNGPKLLLPPKSSSKSSSSDQEEIEIEIAEVLYGMMRQPQVPLKPEVSGSDSMRFESREDSRLGGGDAKSSRISSPIPNSQSPTLPQNSRSALTPLSVIAPKRKKSRPVKYDDETPPTFSARNNPISVATNAETELTAKIDAASPNLDRVRGSVNENGVAPYDSAKPGMEAQLRKVDTNDSKPSRLESEDREIKEGPQSSPRKESSSFLRLDDDNRVDSMTATKASEVENQREEKFQIDLMAAPSRSSPERDGDFFFSADPKPSLVPDLKTESKPISKDDVKTAKVAGGEHGFSAAVAEEVKPNAESQKHVLPSKEKTVDLHLDLHKTENGMAASTVSKLNQPLQQQQQQHQQSLSHPEKTAQPSNPSNFPMSVAGWPGGLPPMGYMAAPLQGVVSMDGSTAAPAASIQPPQWLFNKPRPKKCATHCYIARNIQYDQQITRMNPFWPPATAGSASLYGAKPGNLNVVPPSELNGNAPSRVPGNLMPDKNQNMALFPGRPPPGKEKAPQATNGIDASQGKQVLLQQTVPPGAPNNIMGPAFIFPLTPQQQAAAAASVRSGAVKSNNNPGGSTASSSASTSSSSSSSTAISATAAATAMSFNYPNMPCGETQYLAILQNNPYPFPVPTHVGAATPYRGNPAQAMPLFNGSFYSSQMLHPSQLQQAPNPTQQTQNASISSSSSSSQKKHLQSQQHRRQSSVGNNGSLPGFPAAKHRTSHQQQNQNQHGMDGTEDADGRATRSNMNIYAQSFPMAMHPNLTLIQSAANANASPGNANENKQLPHQQGSSKAGFDSLPSQAFAMSFASLNGSASAQNLDISSMAPSHASMLQSLPEATRHSYQMFAAAQTLQKKNFRASDDSRGGGGNDAAASADDERKSMVGKGPLPTIGHSIAFSRSDLTETGNNVVDSSARTLNLGTVSARSSGSVMPPNVVNSPTSQQLQRNHQHQQQQHQQQQHHQQQQQQQQHQQQLIQLQKQQQFAVAAASRSMNPAATSNGSNGQNHSPQWKNSARGGAAPSTPSQSQSQVPPTLNSATAGSIKGHPQQQQSRSLQGQTQISFAASNTSNISSKAPNANAQQQPLPSSNKNQAQTAVGSPTASSMSKSAGGSPRTSATSTSTGNKTAQASTLSNHQQQQQQQQGKSSSSIPGHKSSPVVSGKVPSMLGNSHIMSSSSAGGTKHHQQQLQKQSLQQTQLFFTNPYIQVHNPHSPGVASAAAAATNAYYHGRQSSDPQQQLKQQPQQQHGSSGTTSSGMLSLCSPSNASTCDPVKAVAASNMKGGSHGHPLSQGILHAAPFAVSASPHQLVPAGFTYGHTVPNSVQVKSAEQKQPAAAREESRRSDT